MTPIIGKASSPRTALFDLLRRALAEGNLTVELPSRPDAIRLRDRLYNLRRSLPNGQMLHFSVADRILFIERDPIAMATIKESEK